MSDTTKTTTEQTLTPLDRPCEECGAAPGEKCRPYCTAEPPAAAAWTTFDQSTYREFGPSVTGLDGSVVARWCLTVRKAMGAWVWYVIDRSQAGDDGYALVAVSGEAPTMRKARAAADTAFDTATTVEDRS